MSSASMPASARTATGSRRLERSERRPEIQGLRRARSGSAGGTKEDLAYRGRRRGDMNRFANPGSLVARSLSAGEFALLPACCEADTRRTPQEDPPSQTARRVVSPGEGQLSCQTPA